MQEADGSQRLLYTRICRPPGDVPARVVLINHGSPPDAAVRPKMRPTACENEAVEWFLKRNFLVVLGQRRGYGLSAGRYAESSVSCSSTDYVAAGLESARDIRALVSYAMTLPYARRGHVVVLGQSAGGWATVALNEQPPADVVALISMAGGRGGHMGNVPNNNCRPHELTKAAGQLGAAAKLPMLWVYTANDSYFGPDLAAAMHAAYVGAGGQAAFSALPPFAQDGHTLLFGKGGSVVWGPLIEGYLKSRPGGL